MLLFLLLLLLLPLLLRLRLHLRLLLLLLLPLPLLLPELPLLPLPLLLLLPLHLRLLLLLLLFVRALVLALVLCALCFLLCVFFAPETARPIFLKLGESTGLYLGHLTKLGALAVRTGTYQTKKITYILARPQNEKPTPILRPITLSVHLNDPFRLQALTGTRIQRAVPLQGAQ